MSEANNQAGPSGQASVRDGPFDIQGGGGGAGSEKNKMSSTKLKINSLLYIQRILSKLFHLKAK